MTDPVTEPEDPAQKFLKMVLEKEGEEMATVCRTIIAEDKDEERPFNVLTVLTRARERLGYTDRLKFDGANAVPFGKDCGLAYPAHPHTNVDEPLDVDDNGGRGGSGKGRG